MPYPYTFYRYLLQQFIHLWMKTSSKNIDFTSIFYSILSNLLTVKWETKRRHRRHFFAKFLKLTLAYSSKKGKDFFQPTKKVSHANLIINKQMDESNMKHSQNGASITFNANNKANALHKINYQNYFWTILISRNCNWKCKWTFLFSEWDVLRKT